MPSYVYVSEDGHKIDVVRSVEDMDKDFVDSDGVVYKYSYKDSLSGNFKLNGTGWFRDGY